MSLKYKASSPKTVLAAKNAERWGQAAHSVGGRLGSEGASTTAAAGAPMPATSWSTAWSMCGSYSNSMGRCPVRFPSTFSESPWRVHSARTRSSSSGASSSTTRTVSNPRRLDTSQSSGSG